MRKGEGAESRSGEFTVRRGSGGEDEGPHLGSPGDQVSEGEREFRFVANTGV